MKAILIDPFERKLSEVEYSGDYKQIYEHIDCHNFDCVRISSKGDTIFVDDEGLISCKVQCFFGFIGYPQPLAGKGLVLGTDINGESVDTTMTLEEMRKLVKWLIPIEVDGVVNFYVLNADETEH